MRIQTNTIEANTIKKNTIETNTIEENKVLTKLKFEDYLESKKKEIYSKKIEEIENKKDKTKDERKKLFELKEELQQIERKERINNLSQELLKDMKKNGVTNGERKIDLNRTRDKNMFALSKDMKKNIVDIYRKKVNFACLVANIEGIQKINYFAHSAINEKKVKSSDAHFEKYNELMKEISIKPVEQKFKTKKVNNENIVDGEKAWDRSIDSENKIFSEIDNRLKDKIKTKGQIILYTELECCPSCKGVIEQFKEKYPNIDIEVLYKKEIGGKI